MRASTTAIAPKLSIQHSGLTFCKSPGLSLNRLKIGLRIHQASRHQNVACGDAKDPFVASINLNPHHILFGQKK
jgi:hypothetical protein